MQETSPIRLIDDFLGSVQIFSSAVNDLLEEQLREVTGSGLTFSQLKLLNLIAHTEGHTITDVAAFFRALTLLPLPQQTGSFGERMERGLVEQYDLLHSGLAFGG
jgi:hypothetical protein